MNEQHTEGQPQKEPLVRQPEVLSSEVGEAPARAVPRIYVASLSDYNAGVLHGSWIDATGDIETMQSAVSDMLARSPTTARYGDVAEEFAIHDYEGFGCLRLGEYTSLDSAGRIGSGIVAHGEPFAAWADQIGSDLEQLDRFEECYLGEWESVETFAEALIEEYGVMDDIEKAVPGHLSAYLEFDYAAFARDLHYGGDIVPVDTPTGGVWIFGP